MAPENVWKWKSLAYTTVNLDKIACEQHYKTYVWYRSTELVTRLCIDAPSILRKAVDCLTMNIDQTIRQIERLTSELYKA